MSKAENQGWATIIPHTGIEDSQGYSLEVAYGTESSCAHLGQPIDPHSNYHAHTGPGVRHGKLENTGLMDALLPHVPKVRDAYMYYSQHYLHRQPNNPATIGEVLRVVHFGQAFLPFINGCAFDIGRQYKELPHAYTALGEVSTGLLTGIEPEMWRYNGNRRILNKPFDIEGFTTEMIHAHSSPMCCVFSFSDPSQGSSSVARACPVPHKMLSNILDAIAQNPREIQSAQPPYAEMDVNGPRSRNLADFADAFHEWRLARLFGGADKVKGPTYRKALAALNTDYINGPSQVNPLAP